METNYRSAGAIVEKADAFIQRNGSRHPKHMRASRPQGEPVRHVNLNDFGQQAHYLAQAAADCTESTAVLYRNNDSALPLIDLLERRGIPYACRQRESFFFTSPAVRDRSQEPGGIQKLQRPFYLEAAVLPGLPDAEDGELPRGLQLLSGLPILLPEFLTDAAVLLLGNQLVDELVQIVPELILHSLILQMAAQGVVPPLIQPHTYFSAFHSAAPSFSKAVCPSGLGAFSGGFSTPGRAGRLGLAGGGALRSRNSRTASGTIRSYSSVSASFMRFCTVVFSFFR